MTVVGMITYPGVLSLGIKVSGRRHLRELPNKNVLFVSNHETIFGDAIVQSHILTNSRWSKTLKNPFYLLFPRLNTYFVAADETMREDLLSRLFNLGGSIRVKRSWRQAGQDVERSLDTQGQNYIEAALKVGWVVTFPQGTTRVFARGRMGTAFLIKKCQPTVVPVVVSGLRETFDKKGLKKISKGHPVSVTYKEPLKLDFDADAKVILSQLMDAIEQSEAFWPEGFVPEEPSSDQNSLPLDK